MGRIGYRPSEASVQEIIKISKLPNVILEGIFTHFAVADIEDKTFTREQYKKFKSVCDRLQEEHISIRIRHCCNSAAILDLPEYHDEMVRAGIIMYGLSPSTDIDITRFNFKKVISLKCRIDHIKTIKTGDSVSYGRKFMAVKPTRIASLPIGYADGYTRMLSDKTEVLVHGIIQTGLYISRTLGCRTVKITHTKSKRLSSSFEVRTYGCAKHTELIFIGRFYPNNRTRRKHIGAQI